MASLFIRGQAVDIRTGRIKEATIRRPRPRDRRRIIPNTPMGDILSNNVKKIFKSYFTSKTIDASETFSKRNFENMAVIILFQLA